MPTGRSGEITRSSGPTVCTSNMALRVGDDHLQAFRAWCGACGITWHPAVQLVATDDEGLGVFVAADAVGIEEGEVIISVPRQAALSVSTHHTTAAAGAALDQKHALAFAVSSQPESMQPWLALWPTETIGTWALDDEGLRSAFGWNRELCTLHAQQESMARRAHETISSADEVPSWETFRWAMGIVSSRAADVVINGERQPALLPFIDMLNHRPYGLENGKICFEPAGSDVPGAPSEDRLVVRCVRPVAPGQPVTICYGDKANAALLHGYGFATRPNPSDALLLRVPLGAPTDMVAMQRVAMIPSGLLAAANDEGGQGDEQGGPAAEGILSWDAAGTAACLSPELQMLLRAATASSIPELFAALASGAAMTAEDDEQGEEAEAVAADATSVCTAACELPPAAWGLLRESVQDALRALEAKEPSLTGEEGSWPNGVAAVAFQARRDLLKSALEMASSIKVE